MNYYTRGMNACKKESKRRQFEKDLLGDSAINI